jgi:DNA-binding phage protein
MKKIKEFHGMSKTPEYFVWRHMIRRCYCNRDTSFYLYGARGIVVCERWRNSFLDFLKDMGSRPIGRSIERIDNDGNYEPGNCTWATPLEQANNQRKNRKLTFNGQTKTMAQWARLVGLSWDGLKRRIASGWNENDILSIAPRMGPLGSRGNPIEFSGCSKTISQWARDTGIPRACLSRRIRNYNWPIGKALGLPVDKSKWTSKKLGKAVL